MPFLIENGVLHWYPLNEMVSRNRSIAERHLNSELMDRIAEHIVLIHFYGDEQSVPHWRNELQSFLNQLLSKTCKSTIKKDNKRVVNELWFTEREYQEYLDGLTLDGVDNAEEHMNKPMTTNLEDLNKDDFSDMGINIVVFKTTEGYKIKIINL